MPLFIVGFILLVGLLIYAVYYYFIQAPSDSDPRMKKPSSKSVGTARKDTGTEPERKVIYFPSAYAGPKSSDSQGSDAKDSSPENHDFSKDE